MVDFHVIINDESWQLIPLGYCGCGCGQKTKIAPCTNVYYGYKKGYPYRYRQGHGSGHWKGGRKIQGGYIRIFYPNHHRTDNSKCVREHILIAEKALGHPLPMGVQVHHFNGNKEDNQNSNLVICQDQAYHALLHQRTRAYKACGHASWLKCRYCKQYDDPDKMQVYKTDRPGYRRAQHSDCRKKFRKKRRRETTMPG